MKKLLFAAALAVLIIAPSCKNRRNNTDVDNTDSTAVEEPVVPLQEDRTLDDAARILAGLPVAEDSPVAYWMEKEVWKTHRAEMDDLWKICRETLTKIDTFAVKDIKDINDKAKQVFYPFSGPDFPYAATFFPKPTTYWFMALEKTGSIPSLNGMSENTFGMYRNAMRTHLKSSYFITNAMDNDLANEIIDGTIPIMMVLIARMDFHIASIAYKNLEEDLSVIPYSLYDSYDFDVEDGYKLIYLNFDYTNYNRVGVKSIYLGGDETNETEIQWFKIEKATEADFDFNAMDIATSNSTSTDGDILQDTTLVAGLVSLTISPKTESATTQNRFWSTNKGPQLAPIAAR